MSFFETDLGIHEERACAKCFAHALDRLMVLSDVIQPVSTMNRVGLVGSSRAATRSQPSARPHHRSPCWLHPKLRNR